MKNIQFVHYIIISLFISGIIAPFLVMQFTEDKKISIVEKRTLAIKPELQFERATLEEYPKQYEEYFNDHFGFRENLVRFYNRFLINLFETSTRPGQIIVGKKDWLFLATPSVLLDYIGSKRLSEIQVKAWKQVLHDREEWLNDLGSRYLFVSPPNKLFLYPEFLPLRYQKLRGVDRTKQLVETLPENPQFSNFVYLEPILKQEKDKGQLYYKHDTHWTMEGSFIAYTAIIEHLKQYSPELNALKREELIEKTTASSGDLGPMMNLPERSHETTTHLLIPGYEDVVDFKGEGKRQEKSGNDHEVYRKYSLKINENSKGEDTVLLITDSFGPALQDYLTYHFKKLYVVKNGRFEDVTSLIKEIKPDLVIDLVVSRSIEIAVSDSAVVQDYLRKKKERKEPTVHVDSSSSEFISKVDSLKDIDASEKESTVHLSLKGWDSQLFFNLSEKMSEGAVKISYRIVSPVDTNFILYYQSADCTDYSSKRHFSQRLRKGENSFNIWVHEPMKMDKIRIDPGEIPGEYQLKQFSIVEFSG